MADDLAALAQRERARADVLGAAAADATRGAITATLAQAARAAIEAIQVDMGRGAIGEPAADLRDIRTEPDLVIARARDLARAEMAARDLLVAALAEGFETDATGRAALMRGPHLQVEVHLTERDREDLADYPIHGRSPKELARRLRELLGDAIDETLARPLTGTIEPSALPPALGEVARLHSERVGNAVAEAYFAGVQAATRAIGRALVGG